jgi:hypothetical protein
MKNFASNIKKSLIDASNKGAIGLKIYKNLGLDLKDSKGNRIKIDDKRLNVIWETCAKLGMPILIHSGEPSPFFDPVDKFNERWLHARQRPKVLDPLKNTLHSKL